MWPAEDSGLKQGSISLQGIMGNGGLPGHFKLSFIQKYTFEFFQKNSCSETPPTKKNNAIYCIICFISLCPKTFKKYLSMISGRNLRQIQVDGTKSLCGIALWLNLVFFWNPCFSKRGLILLWKKSKYHKGFPHWKFEEKSKKKVDNMSQKMYFAI